MKNRSELIARWWCRHNSAAGLVRGGVEVNASLLKVGRPNARTLVDMSFVGYGVRAKMVV